MKSNDQLRTDVEQVLEWEPQLDESRLSVSANDGAVTRNGHVPPPRDMTPREAMTNGKPGAHSSAVGTTPQRRSGGIVSATASSAIAAVSGVAPHVLHHVGFLAGLAFVSGAAGTVLFGVLGLALSIPFLLRLRRRFGTYLAPAIALIVMAAMFSLSAFVIGPAISGQ